MSGYYLQIGQSGRACVAEQVILSDTAEEIWNPDLTCGVDLGVAPPTWGGDW